MNTNKKNLLLITQVFLSLIFLCFTNAALAHVELEKTNPLANSQLTISPPELVLNYEHAVMLTNLTLTDETRKIAIDFHFVASTASLKTHTFLLPKLDNGRYTVNWAAASQFGHPLSGSFSFVVGQP